MVSLQRFLKLRSTQMLPEALYHALNTIVAMRWKQFFSSKTHTQNTIAHFLCLDLRRRDSYSCKL